MEGNWVSLNGWIDEKVERSCRFDAHIAIWMDPHTHTKCKAKWRKEKMR
jgi:hypothetical protein